MSDLELSNGSKSITFGGDVDEDLELCIEIQGKDTSESYQYFYIKESQAKRIVDHLNYIFDFNRGKKKELKQFLRENLELVIECESPMGPGNNQEIGLRFKGDDDCFAKETVYVPDED